MVPWVSYVETALIAAEQELIVFQSAFYGAPKPDEDRFKVLDKLYESGELFWDSADMYMDNEDLLSTQQASDLIKRLRLTSIQANGSRPTQAKGTTSSSPPSLPTAWKMASAG